MQIDRMVWGVFFATQHPVKTAQCVAARINASERTVEKWLDGTACPSLPMFCRLVAAYGPEFLSLCLPGCDWLTAAAREKRRDRLDAELARISAELARFESHE